MRNNKCSGDGIPQHIQRPLSTDNLFEVSVRFNKITEYERNETVHVWADCITCACRNVSRWLQDNGFEWNIDDDYWENPNNQDVCTISFASTFYRLNAINGTVTAQALAAKLWQVDQDTEVTNA